jgi:hypothetical protein
MLKEVRLEELGLWIANFGDVNLLYDDMIRDLYLKPEEIDDGIILLRHLGVQKIYDFYVEGVSNKFFLYRMWDSEVILVYDKPITVLAFEENGRTVYKPDKVRYYSYRKTEIFHIYPCDVYYEGVKFITPNGEIVINKAHSKA